MTNDRALPAPPESEPQNQDAAWPQALVFLGAIVLMLIALLAGGGAEAERVYFIQPEDGATVPTTFTVEMGAEGLAVEPAGEINEGAGHFHVLVNTDFVPVGEIIPADEQHLHYGDGRTTTELTLEPGEYVLRLQFADGVHAALDYTDEITITVAGE